MVIDMNNRIGVSAGTSVTLRSPRVAFPSYQAFAAEIKVCNGKVDDIKFHEIYKRLEMYMLEIGTAAVVVNDSTAFDMVRIRLSDGRECDVTSIIEGEQNLT